MGGRRLYRAPVDQRGILGDGLGRLPASRRWLVRGLGVGLRQVRRAQRVVTAAGRVLEGFALSACRDEELSRLTEVCYAGQPEVHRSDLFPWERAWLERELPPPPGRVLVGGSGHGREVAWLRGRGYDTVAFDPVVAADAGRGMLRARYEDLLAEGHAATQAIRQAAPYSAVLLGWGSFTHVPGAETRARVLKVLGGMSEGPMLLSYWSVQGGSVARGRAHATGAALGRRLGGPREERAGASKDVVAAHCGYAHCFSDDEVQALGDRAGFDAHCEHEGYPHATLRPRRADSRSMVSRSRRAAIAQPLNEPAATRSSGSL